MIRQTPKLGPRGLQDAGALEAAAHLRELVLGRVDHREAEAAELVRIRSCLERSGLLATASA